LIVRITVAVTFAIIPGFSLKEKLLKLRIGERIVPSYALFWNGRGAVLPSLLTLAFGIAAPFNRLPIWRYKLSSWDKIARKSPGPQPTPRTPEIMPDLAAAYSTAPLSDDPELVTRPLPAIAASARLPEQEPPPDAPVGMPSAWALTERDRAATQTAPRRPWPLRGLLGRREVATKE